MAKISSQLRVTALRGTSWCESARGEGAPAGVRLTWQGGTCWRESARGEGAPAGVNIPGLPVISNPAWDQR